MGLNIKNERVHELAREAARRSGQSQTSVIEEALRQLLEAMSDAPDRRRQVVEGLLADVDRRLTDEQRARLTTEHLYNEQGLPA